MGQKPKTIRPEELLAQMGWVQSLAQGLVRDPNLADDVAQDAWVHARESPPTRETSGSSLRAWLARVTRTLARDSRRSQARRAERERKSARPESQPSTIEVVTRAATQQRLVDAVMALEEPYRATILLRYLDGLSTDEIAERTGVSTVGVRQRLSRGLEQLRGRLDREFGSDRSAWSAGLLHVARATPTSTGPGWFPAAKTTGGITMATSTATAGTLKVLAAVGVCAGILVAVPFVTRSSKERETSSGVEVAAAPELERSVRSENPTTAPDLDKPNPRVLVPAPASSPENIPQAAPSDPAKTAARDQPSDPMLLPEETLNEMRAKYDAIRQLLQEKSTPILLKRFDDNLSVRISDGQEYAATSADNAAIFGVQMPAGGRGVYRTSLPREEYPELYILKDATLRLDKLISQKEVEEFLAKRKREQDGATPR